MVNLIGVILMMTNELYFVLPAVLMAFLATYLLVPVLYSLMNKLAVLKGGSQKRQFSGSRFSAGMGILIAVLLSFQLWSINDLRTFHPYFFSSLALFLLSGYISGNGFLYSIKRIGIQFTAAVVLMVGISSEAGSYFGFLGIEGLSAHLVVFLFSGMIILITALFSYMSRVSDLIGGIVIIITGVLGIWFWAAGFLSIALFSFIISSSVIGYKMCYTNIKSIKLGGFGWSSLGFVIAFLMGEFLVANAMVSGQEIHLANSGNLILSLLMIPLVIWGGNVLSRKTLINRKSKSGYNIVHLYKKLDMDESQISFLFWMISLIIIGMAYSTMHLNPLIQTSVIIVFSVLYTTLTYKAVLFTRGLSQKFSKAQSVWVKE